VSKAAKFHRVNGSKNRQPSQRVCAVPPTRRVTRMILPTQVNALTQNKCATCCENNASTQQITRDNRQPACQKERAIVANGNNGTAYLEGCEEAGRGMIKAAADAKKTYTQQC
jgi:hypothetical protein